MDFLKSSKSLLSFFEVSFSFLTKNSIRNVVYFRMKHSVAKLSLVLLKSIDPGAYPDHQKVPINGTE